MANLRTLRRRIKSVENIHDITKAMEMISAVRFKRIEDKYKKTLPYIQDLQRLMSRLLTEDRVEEHPLFEKRSGQKELLMVITGDRGLCGGFNSNLLKIAQDYFSKSSNRVTFYPVGKVGTGFVRRRGWPVKQNMVDIGYKFTPASMRQKLDEILDWYLKGEFDSVKVLSMHYLRAGVQKPVMEPFLNLRYLFEGPKETTQEKAKGPDLHYIFEPEQKATLARLMDLYVRQHFFIILLRSITAEYNARMLAMKLATENADEVIDTLTLQRNKVRQASITREITELIGGVEALK